MSTLLQTKSVQVFMLSALAGCLAAQPQAAPSVDRLPWTMPSLERFRFAGGANCGRDGAASIEVSLSLPRSMETVTGAPFSARDSSSQVTTLPNGSHLSSHSGKQEFRNWRDSEGRVRTENSDAPDVRRTCRSVLVQIEDSVAGYFYLLDPVNKIAYRVPLQAKPYVADLDPPRYLSRPDAPKVKREALGTKTVSGAELVGVRTTMTYAPGTYNGNDAPFTQVQEDWISLKLGMAVEHKTSDATGLATTDTLEDLSLAEPDPALLRVPADYRVIDKTPADDSSHNVTFQIEIPAH